MNEIRIRNINRLLPGREANPIRPPKPIRHSPHAARGRVKPINLTRKLRRRPDALLIAVYGVREPDRSVRVHDHVVDGVEGAAVEVLQQEA